MLQHTFQFPTPNKKNRETVEQMKNAPSVGVHVRRGDYVGNRGFGGICTLDYYKKALAMIESTPETFYYVFSNDISWCEENLRALMKNVCYVNWNKGKDSAWDMYLMSQCNQLIIANSSFSWWGAYLNKKAGKIIAPKTWNNCVNDVHIQMPDWLLI